MVLFLSFIAFALAGIEVASALKRAPSPAGVPSINLITPVENTVTSRELRVESNLEKRFANNTCTDDSQAEFISDSYYEGRILATTAIDYLNSYGTSDPVFIDYFGVNATTISGPLSIFTNVTNSYNLTLSCTDPYGYCASYSYAYALVGELTIYYCTPFYFQADTASLCDGPTVDLDNIRGGTTLLDMVHSFTWTGNDGNDTCSDARAQAQYSSSLASDNCANYSCFAMQAFINTQCVQGDKVLPP